MNVAPRTTARQVLAVLLAVSPAGAADFDLAAAIAAAEGGDTITVPAGTYAGPFVIEKPMTLAADGRVVLDGGGEGDIEKAGRIASKGCCPVYRLSEITLP